MGATRKVILELPEEDAALLDELVAGGSDRSPAHVVGEALRHYHETEIELESWLRNTVGPTVDAVRANPGACHAGDDVLARLHLLHQQTIATRE